MRNMGRLKFPFIGVVVLVVASAAGCDGILGPWWSSDVRLEFGAPIDHVEAGRPLPRIIVLALDSTGRRVERGRGDVHLRLRPNTSDAVLVGRTTTPVQNGIATFDDPTIDRPGSGLVLEATVDEDGPAIESNAFASVEAPDLIRVHNASTDPGAGPIRFLIKGRSARGFADRLTAVSDAPYAEVILERATESNEVVVFQNGRAPGIVDARWTAGVDTVDVTLPDPFPLPITVWFIAGGDFDDMRDTIRDAFHGAQAIYDSMAIGLDIVSELEIVDASQSPRADEYSSIPVPGGDFARDIGRREGRINVYSVISIYYGTHGTQIGKANHPTATFTMSPAAWYPKAVAHEIGHMFALRHTNLVEGFGDDPNLMGRMSNVLTDGQIFYVHFADRSAVNRTYGLRTAHARPCPNEVNDPRDPRCLPLNTQVR